MRSLLLLGFAVLAACGNDRVLLELKNDFGADHIEVMLLEPRAFVTQQRVSRNDPQERFEAVPYLVRRTSVEFDLQPGETTHGLRLEIQQTGGPYVPLVIATGPDVRAMGIYDSGTMFAKDLEPDRALDGIELMSDVTIYEIPLEQVQIIDPQNEPVLSNGQMIEISCDAELQGFAWRLGDGNQLRVATPPAGTTTPFDTFDFDCDEYDAGELDCDDLFLPLHSDIQESCNKQGDDCFPPTSMSIVQSGTCALCGQIPFCVCDDRAAELLCPALHVCFVPSEIEDQPCPSNGDIARFVDCMAGCTATLERKPQGWDVRLGGNGLGKPLVVMPARELKLEVRATASFDPEPRPEPDPVLIRVERTGQMPTLHSFSLEVDSRDQCSAGLRCANIVVAR